MLDIGEYDFGAGNSGILVDHGIPRMLWRERNLVSQPSTCR